METLYNQASSPKPLNTSTSFLRPAQRPGPTFQNQQSPQPLQSPYTSNFQTMPPSPSSFPVQPATSSSSLPGFNDTTSYQSGWLNTAKQSWNRFFERDHLRSNFSSPAPVSPSPTSPLSSSPSSLSRVPSIPTIRERRQISNESPAKSPNRRKVEVWENSSVQQVEKMNKFHNDQILFYSFLFIVAASVMFLITHSPLRILIVVLFYPFAELDEFWTLTAGNCLSLSCFVIGIIAGYRYCSTPSVHLTSNQQRVLLGMSPSTNVRQVSFGTRKQLSSPEKSPAKLSESFLQQSPDNLLPPSYIPQIGRIGSYQNLSIYPQDAQSIVENVVEPPEEISSPQQLKNLLKEEEEKEKETSTYYPTTSYEMDTSYWGETGPSLKYYPSVVPQPRIQSHSGMLERVAYDKVLQKMDLQPSYFDMRIQYMRNWFYSILIKPLADQLTNMEKSDIDVTAPVPTNLEWQNKIGPQRDLQNLILLLQKYLHVPGCTSHKLLIKRIQALARQQYLADYQCRLEPNQQWANAPEFSNDAQILIHLFCTFLDEQMGGNRAFSSKYFAQTPQNLEPHPGTIVIYQSEVKETPHFDLAVSNEMWVMPKGKNNLFIALVIFLVYIKKHFNGFLGQILLSSKQIRLMQVIDI